MGEASEIKMEVDGNEATDQQAESNAQTEKINLLEMPIEILEKILINSDDAKHLLTASHVCKSFASVAETAFAQIYSKKVYRIVCRHSAKEKSFHKVVLNKYGAKIRNIKISIEDDEILDLIEQKCSNLKDVTLTDVSRIPILKDLKNVKLGGIRNMDRYAFTEFIHNNRQLETLRFDGIEVDLVDALDGRLNMLKTLAYEQYTNFTTDLRKIRLNSLETLELTVPDIEGYTRLLQAMNCNRIKVLDLWHDSDFGDGDDFIHEICAFKMLVSLRLSNFRITEDQIRKLAHHLPRLTKFSMKTTQIESNAVNRILSVLSIFSKLTKLTIELGGTDFRKFLSDLKKSINGFYARFASFGTEIEIFSSIGDNTVSTSKNHIAISEDYSTELHWMANLNERNVRQVIDEVSERHQIYGFKFINNCSESISDISVFMHPYFEDTKSLDIKSNAPISVNANASRYRRFFPKLRTIKLDLGDRTTIDLLGKLDSGFCKQIDELWLNTKNVTKHGEMEHGQGHDMTSVLAKFENLTSLHLDTSSIHFNETQLLLACRKLKDIRFQRPNSLAVERSGE